LSELDNPGNLFKLPLEAVDNKREPGLEPFKLDWLRNPKKIILKVNKSFGSWKLEIGLGLGLGLGLGFGFGFGLGIGIGIGLGIGLDLGLGLGIKIKYLNP
jgi:hypothetical protein